MAFFILVEELTEQQKKSKIRQDTEAQAVADIVMHPSRGPREKLLPATGLLFANPSEAASAMKQVMGAGGKKRFLFNSSLCVDQRETFFVAGPSIGAPMAALCLEKLIALGALRVILAGWCGALRPALSAGTFFLPGQALCGEGTSPYYSTDREPSPSSCLTGWLRIRLREHGATWEEGRVWSTDAPYRESRLQLERLRLEQDIAAVDMEYSSLCTVAKFRGVDFAACMLVSDEIWRRPWHPAYANPVFQKKSQEMVTMLLACMSGNHP